MAVILQKMSNWFSAMVLVVMPFLVLGQQNICNKETDLAEDSLFIPKEVCVPQGDVIYYVYSRHQKIDFNHDGLMDFVCSSSKKTLKVGNKNTLIFYKMNTDSSFTLIREYSNVLPVYFDTDVQNPDFKDANLKKLFDCYQVPNPLESIEIKNDTISILQNVGASGENVLYYFKFDKLIDDWVLVQKSYLFFEQKTILECKKKTLLSKFSYCENE